MRRFDSRSHERDDAKEHPRDPLAQIRYVLGVECGVLTGQAGTNAHEPMPLRRACHCNLRKQR